MAMILLLTLTQVFLRLSWANERPASRPFTFGKRKKSAGAKFGKKGRSAISGMALHCEPVLGGDGIKDRSVVPAPNQCEKWS